MFLNSALVRFLLGVLNPTINFQIGDLRRLPYKVPDRTINRTVTDSVLKAVSLAKELETFDEASPNFISQNSPSKAALMEISQSEHELQKLIDKQVFDLYEIDKEVREEILKDPWVARTKFI